MKNDKEFKDVSKMQSASKPKPIKFGALEESASSAVPSSIELLKDVPLEIAAELGRTKMPVKDILKLGEGSIVELDKEAGQPVDVRVNNKLIARGEVVEIDGNFGVRLTEIYNK